MFKYNCNLKPTLHETKKLNGTIVYFSLEFESLSKCNSSAKRASKPSSRYEISSNQMDGSRTNLNDVVTSVTFYITLCLVHVYVIEK